MPAAVHGAAVGGDEGDSPVGSVKDDLVIAHVGRADHGAVVLVIEDAEAPHAAAQLISVLPRPEVDPHAVAHMQREVGELVDIRRAHRVAIVVWVLALGGARRARAPRAVRAKVVADGSIGIGWQVHKGRARVDDGARKSACRAADGAAADLEIDETHRVRGRTCIGDPQARGHAVRHCTAQDKGSNALREAHREDVRSPRALAHVVEEGGAVGVRLREARDPVGDLRVKEPTLVRLAAKGRAHLARADLRAKVEEIRHEAATYGGAFRVRDAVAAHGVIARAAVHSGRRARAFNTLRRGRLRHIET